MLMFSLSALQFHVNIAWCSKELEVVMEYLGRDRLHSTS